MFNFFCCKFSRTYKFALIICLGFITIKTTLRSEDSWNNSDVKEITVYFPDTKVEHCHYFFASRYVKFTTFFWYRIADIFFFKQNKRINLWWVFAIAYNDYILGKFEVSNFEKSL